MRSFVASIITTAITLMTAMPAIAQQKATESITPKMICDRMAQARTIISEDKVTGERRGHPMIIRALKDAKRIQLAVRKLAPECLPGSDWRVSLGDDAEIQRALQFHTEQAIRAGFDVTRLFTPAELSELAGIKK